MPDTAAKITAALKQDGAIVVHSTHAKCDVLWVRDRAVRLLPAWRNLPLFTRDDLAEVVRMHPTPEELAVIVDAKRQFPGQLLDPKAVRLPGL